MTVVHEAPGLAADWLNAWLAAVGITVLVPDARLSWSREPVPTARFVVEGDVDLARRVADAMPTVDQLRQLPIARSHDESAFELEYHVDRQTFIDRARLARRGHDGGLEMCLTDLAGDEEYVGQGHFNVPVPSATKRTIHDRLLKCRGLIPEDIVASVQGSLDGRVRRVKANGLGFDFRRASSGVHPDTSKWVDPVVECLCFAGLAQFPVRGDGKHLAQRGWTSEGTRRRVFVWPVWVPFLDRWGIDAMLDLRNRKGIERRLRSIGVSGLYRSVAQQPKSSSDSYRAYASERLW